MFFHKFFFRLRAEKEYKLMQRHLWKIQHDPDMPEKVRKLIPTLRFLDKQYLVAHPGMVPWSLEMLAEKMLQNYSSLEEQGFFNASP